MINKTKQKKKQKTKININIMVNLCFIVGVLFNFQLFLLITQK